MLTIGYTLNGKFDPEHEDFYLMSFHIHVCSHFTLDYIVLF